MPDVDILVNNAGLALGVASAIETPRCFGDVSGLGSAWRMTGTK